MSEFHPIPNADRMHRYDDEMTQLIVDYVEDRLKMHDTTLDFPGDRQRIMEAVEGLITPEGHDPRKVLDIYEHILATAVVSADSPRFFAFIPAAPTKASLLMDMIVSASSLQGCSWLEAAGAVVAENQALRFLADLAGLPETSGGTFVSGGSAGNLSALVVARDTARLRLGRERRLRVAVSDQAHSSIRNALNIIDCDALIVPTVNGRHTGEMLRATLEADSDPESVVAVVATAGTTNAGIIDDLAGISAVARARQMWMHVDAAYGGAGLLSDRVRPLYDGIEFADSIVMDPHKWWFAPFDSGALLYRDPVRAKAVHTQDASYLDVIHADVTDLNPSDLAYHLTRRARGLALWFSLAVYGTDAYRDAVNAALDITQYTAERIRELPYTELVLDPTLSVLLFRRLGWGPEEYTAWSDELIANQTAFITPSAWQGETVGRFAFLHPSTTPEMVDAVLATLA